MRQHPKNETALRTDLVRSFTDFGAHAVRIESPDVSAGVPDANVALDDKECWLELKRPPRLPMRNHGLSPKQEAWIRRRLLTGRDNVYIVVFMEGTTFVLDAGVWSYVNNLDVDGMHSTALAVTSDNTNEVAAVQCQLMTKGQAQ